MKKIVNEDQKILNPVIFELKDIKFRIERLLNILGDDEEVEDDVQVLELKPEFETFETYLAEKKSGKCPASGCVKKVDNKWRVISNKTGKLWPAHYDTEEDANDALAAYHIH